MIIRRLIVYFLNCRGIHRLRYLYAIFIIKNIVRDSAFTECNVFEFVFFIDDCLAYIITFFINFINLRYSVIKRIIDNLNVEFDVIEIQSVRCENDLMLLS